MKQIDFVKNEGEKEKERGRENNMKNNTFTFNKIFNI